MFLVNTMACEHNHSFMCSMYICAVASERLCGSHKSHSTEYHCELLLHCVVILKSTVFPSPLLSTEQDKRQLSSISVITSFLQSFAFFSDFPIKNTSTVSIAMGSRNTAPSSGKPNELNKPYASSLYCSALQSLLN